MTFKEEIMAEYPVTSNEYDCFDILIASKCTNFGKCDSFKARNEHCEVFRKRMFQMCYNDKLVKIYSARAETLNP